MVASSERASPSLPVDEAAREKLFSAERATAGVRAAVIGLNSLVYLFLMDKAQTVAWLAYTIIVVANVYGALVLTLRPYRHYPVLYSAWFTSVTDAVLITLWLYATGGFESPFFPLWYVSIAAIAFRFDYKTTLAVAALYAGTYLGLLVVLEEFVPHFSDVVVRLSYIFFVAFLGGLLSRETLAQTEAKIEMRNLVLETQRQSQEIAKREVELSHTVSTLNATLDSTADGILVVDPENHITHFNRRFVEMWGIPDDIIQSRDDQRAIGFVLDQLRDPAGFVAKVQELYASQAESFDVLEFKDARVFERYSRPQRVGNQAVGRVWSFRDVTLRRQGEQEKLRAIEKEKELLRLKELDQFKTQFMNTIAHELWTPLTPIKLQIHMLKGGKGGPLNSEQQSAVDMIDRNMERLTRLVEEMLDSARLQAGRFKVQREPMDLAAVVREMVDLFHIPCREAGILLTDQVDSNLTIEGDANRLVQVMYNLLSNAVKFTPAGGSIHVHAFMHEGKAIVEVKDTGIGLTVEQIGRLFQAFSQAHDVMQRTKSGTGLGLYISRAILEAHGGIIYAESEGKGKGSKFTFAIPLPTSGKPGEPKPRESAGAERTAPVPQR